MCCYVHHDVDTVGSVADLNPSAGKLVQQKLDWFWFGFSLVEKVA